MGGMRFGGVGGHYRIEYDGTRRRLTGWHFDLVQAKKSR